MKVLTCEQEEALKLLSEIEKRMESLDNRRLAVRRCLKWYNEYKENPNAQFALQAACEYLVDTEKERNSVIYKYNKLRKEMLAHGWSAEDLPCMDETHYNNLPINNV